jgi:RNA recognition motif-containing protein
MVTDDRCKLFVAGLPDSISEAVLRQLFEATGGTVVDVSVPRDRATGRTRGFGFVTMSSEDEARDARQSLDFRSTIPIGAAEARRCTAGRRTGRAGSWRHRGSDAVSRQSAVRRKFARSRTDARTRRSVFGRARQPTARSTRPSARLWIRDVCECRVGSSGGRRAPRSGAQRPASVSKHRARARRAPGAAGAASDGGRRSAT